MIFNWRLKSHRKLLCRHGAWWSIRGAKKPHRNNDRILGVHYRWWALGQYALRFDEPCRDVKGFLFDVDFVGIDGAVAWEVCRRKAG